MRDRKSYVAPYGLGETMTGGAVGRVVVSNAEGIAVGDHVRFAPGSAAIGDDSGQLLQTMVSVLASLGAVGAISDAAGKPGALMLSIAAVAIAAQSAGHIGLQVDALGVDDDGVLIALGDFPSPAGPTLG